MTTATKQKKSNNKETYLHFRLFGEDLTRIVRNLVRDGRHDHALKTLKDGLIGISTDQCISVLNGDYKLIGNETDGIEMVTDNDSEEYKKELDWQYSDVVQLNKCDFYYKPYAYVTGYCQSDLSGSSPRPDKYEDGFKDKFSYNRAMYYANNRNEDRAYIIPLGQKKQKFAVLFEKVPSPPFWYERTTKNHVEAAQIAFDNNRLNAREFRLRDHYHFEEDVKAETKSNTNTQDAVKNMLKELVPEQFQSVADNVVDAIVGDVKVDAIEDVLLNSDMGYVLPDGRFFGCKYMQHNMLAQSIYEDIFDVEDKHDYEKSAESEGWMVVKRGIGGHVYIFCEKPTEKQADTIKAWYDKHRYNICVEDMVDAKRFIDDLPKM